MNKAIVLDSKQNPLEKYSCQLTILQEVHQLIASDETTENILGVILNHLLETLGYRAAQVYQLSASDNSLWLYLEAGQGNKPSVQKLDIFSMHENNIISEAARQEKPIYIPDTYRGPYLYAERPGETNQPGGSELAIPFKYGQKVLGILRIESDKTEAFDEEDINFASSLANLLASIMRKNQTIHQLQDSIQEVKTLYNLHYEDTSTVRTKYRESISYHYNQGELAEDDVPAKVASFMLIEEGHAGIITTQDNNQRELIAPIRLHGETIGVLGLEDLVKDGKNWTIDDVSLLEEVTSQVALAIENAQLLQQTQERTKELALLFEATRQLSETIDLNEIFNILTNHIINYLDGDRCAVLLLDSTETLLEVIAVKVRHHAGSVSPGAEPQRLTIVDSPSLQSLLKWPDFMIRHLDDPDLEPDMRAYMQRDKGKEAHTLARFPLLVRTDAPLPHKLVAIMEVEHGERLHDYPYNELQLTQAIIAQVTVAIEKAQLFQQTQAALTNTQKLYEISSALVESAGIEDIFNIVLENVKTYDVDRVSISLLDRSKSGEIESVTIAATWDRDPTKQSPVGTKFSAENFALVHTFAQPPFHPLISNDLRRPEGQDERMDEDFRQFVVEELQTITLFSAPMFLGAEYKGVMSIYTRKSHVYTEQEIRVYQTLADQAIIAIENHRLLEATRKERDRAALLYELGQILSRNTTIDQIQETILSFSEKIGATHCELYITDGGELISIASTIPSRQKLPAQELLDIALNQGPGALALSTMKTEAGFRVIQSPSDTGERPWPLANLGGSDATTDIPDLKSYACVPFESRRSTLRGLLTFYHAEADGFTQEHITTFESMAIQVAATLENIWLLEQTNTVLKETELLYEATRSFNSAQGVEDLLDVMVNSFVEAGIDFMAISLIPGQNKTGVPVMLDIVAAWYEETQEIVPSGPKLTPDHYSFIQQLSHDTHHEIDYNLLDPATQANIDHHLYGLRSILAIPLSVGRNWLGVLLIGSKRNNYNFKLNIINQVLNLSGQAAIVIQNLQLVEETQKNLYYSEILSNLGQQLLTTDTNEAIYELTLSAIASTQPDRGAAIFMYDYLEGGVDLEMVGNWDNPHQEWPSIPVGSRFSTEDLGLVPLLKTGLTVVSNKATEDERFSTTLKQLLAMMQVNILVAVPLWLNKDVGGFILITRSEIETQSANTFSADMIRLYEDIGREVSGALENRRLFEEAQHRAWQLQTAAEVSQAVTAYLDLDTLLCESVDLIKERFDFYHVSIFLIDEYRRYAVVEASTGEVGQQMLAMKYKLEVGGPSIVGAATATGQSRLALDVGKDAVHFNNPLLSDTRSEMALPLIAQGRVIGALDVQSTKRAAFSKGDITILQSMASQLANAIEAARSFQESEKAFEEVSRLHQLYMHNKWDEYIKEKRVIRGYHLADDLLSAKHETDIVIHPAIAKALVEKHPIIVPASSSQATNGSQKSENGPTAVTGQRQTEEIQDPSTLIAPLTLNGQAVIGAVDFEISNQDVDTILDEDILSIIEAVTGQAAQAIETARLFEQTQIAREEAEALYQVARILVATEDEQEIFNTVLGKMLLTLGLKQGGILLFEEDKQFGRLHALFENGEAVSEPDLRIPIENNRSYQELIGTKRPVAIEDVMTDPLVETVRDINKARGIVSLLLVPIVINDEVVGAIGADSIGQKHKFTEREMNLAIAMADQLSITLQNRRLIEETRRRALLLQISSDVGRVATSILDEEQMMDEVVDLIKAQFGFNHVKIFLIDEAGQFAVLHKSTGEISHESRFAQTHKLAIGSKSVIGQVTDQYKPIVARSTDTPDQATYYYRNEFSRKTPFSPETQAELAIPLQVGGNLIGALDIQSASPNAFTDEEIATLETLGAQLAVAIQNARAFREQQETAERLKEIDKLKTQFLANMSHELRTPLNSIIGFSRVILKGIDGPLTELQKTDLTSIHNSGQHLLGLINNILDLSKIEAGKMELNFEETEVEPIIKTVISTASALVKDKPVTLDHEVPENLPKIWADPTRLRQVILNLVSNACKFTEEGSVTTRVWVQGAEAGSPGRVYFAVTDTGIGIPEDQLTTIFEEFTQVDASTTRKVGGTGLGLPISRHFVEMHKGKIWVNSILGQGSIFTFYIPIKPSSEEEAVVSDEVLEDDSANQANKRVVVAIDDDPGVITLYKRYLEKQNYEVIGIDLTKDILAQVKASNPFAILLDVVIPDRDGWGLMKELKAAPFTKDIPLIICSIVSDKNKGFSLGATNYLVKPIVENELVEALKHIDHQQKEVVKVLIVDDHADDVLLIRRILEAQSNYNIFEASNGKEGLELVKNKTPDLIILDLNMPEMDGFAMLEVLKSTEKTRAIPIIIVSAEQLSPEDYRRLTGQVEVLLRKGIFTENELLEDVSQALERLHRDQKVIA